MGERRTRGWGDQGTSRFDRRELITASAGLVAFGLATPHLALAQSATPEADAEATGAATGETGALTLYSGRNETLMAPLIETYVSEAGSEVDVRYGSTGELAATILEEGDDTPAGAFLAQDAGSLGLLADEDRFAAIPDALLEKVGAPFRDPEGHWVGVSGRARVLAYNTASLTEADLPSSVRYLTDPAWANRIGWAPENASFQSFITAFRVLDGDDAVRDWLEAMIANGAVNFGDSNTAIVKAIGAGEIDAGLVNHYYVYVVGREEGEGFPVANHFFAAGDPGSLVNVAGIGLLADSAEAEPAAAFAAYLLSDQAQEYFATQTFEYPLVAGVAAPEGLRPLADVGSPDIDLSDLADLRGTLDLLAEVGLL